MSASNAKKNNAKIITIVYIALMSAITAALSQIAIPLPTGIPITLQTFAVSLAGFLLGPIFGTVSIVVYIALGAIGVPVFSSFGAGIGKLIGLTGGFIWGFIPFSALCGVGARIEHIRRTKLASILSLVTATIGLLICHIFGSAQYAALSGNGFGKSFLLVSVPYLIKDVLSVIAAWMLAKVLRKCVKLPF